MFDLARGRLAIKYIIFELLPVFIMGLSVFVFILIMIQSFKLSEYVIVHGAPLSIMSRLVFYMTLSYLPILFPIALLFAVLLVYGRMSGDSEIVAFKALGLTPVHITVPALVVGGVISLLSLQTSFQLAPWGQRNLDELINVLAQTRPGATIREGVFSEGFFDLVVYAHNIDSKSGNLQKIFIYDEREAKSPVTIIAKEGKVLNSNNISGNEASMQLINGNLHKSSDEFYTKIDFKTYDINLYDAHEIKKKDITPDSMNLAELREAIKQTNLGASKNSSDIKRLVNLTVEWNRRWMLSVACLIFVFLGVSLSAATDRRSARSGSMVICISAIVIYWTLNAWLESLGRAGHLPLIITAWLPNTLFLIFAMFQFKRVVQT